MDDLQKISVRAKLYLSVILIAENTLLTAGWLATESYVPTRWQLPVLLGCEMALIVLSYFIAAMSVRWLTSPLKLIWQSVLQLSPQAKDMPPPNTSHLKFGRELVANLINQVYQLASTNRTAPAAAKLDFVSTYLPLPVFVIDENDAVKFANNAASEYLAKKKEDLVGRAIYDLLDMSFMDKDTLDAWLKNARSSAAVAKKTWSRVKLNLEDGRATNQFDLAAYYNKGNADHFETILVLFDHTDSYGSDDDQANFLALAVHELRNPLTMLRGYIEVLEEEVDDKSNLEFTTDLQKMRASAQLLAEYTNNILNVSRVDSDQLNLHLRSEDWSALVNRVAESMVLRARVHGMEIKTDIAPNLPPVGVDSVSISEVLMNLIDNAIKYGGQTKTIMINSRLNQSGEIETTVNDRGSVIDPAVIGNLFQRFYRSHRTRSQANGTGLGLYLSKALVEAHGGNIWISSNERDGTTAGFTVLPYSRIADERKSENGNDIVRVPHGWIKNHSLYRR